MAELIPKTPVSQTKDATAAAFLSINNAYSLLTLLPNSGFGLLWANPYGLAPQDAANAMHQHALDRGFTFAQLYQLQQAAAQFVNTLTPGTVPSNILMPPPGFMLTFNPDGSPVVGLVPRVATSITISPATATLAPSGTQTFTATVLDQFGQPLTTQPTVTWDAGIGTVDAAGNYTASAADGSDAVVATLGSLTASATITIQG